MDEIGSLIEEHGTLRRLAVEIEKAVGARRDVGWDDCVSCDMKALRRAQGR